MRPTTAILAAGDFPRKGGAAARLLATAKRVVCCDGAADAYRRRTGKDPTAVVGDCDSLKGRFAETVRIAEQETNDLDKAIRFCRGKGWKGLFILGATGKREDHTIGNVFRALDHGVEVVTDHGRFVPVHGRATLTVRRGAAISIFAPDPATRMTSTGLAWPLDGIRFRTLHCATLNRAIATKVSLTSTRPVSVYIAERP